MNLSSLTHPGETGRYTRCWAVSLFLHAGPVLMVLALVPSPPLVHQPEPFKWEVSVIEPPPQPVATPATVPVKPAPVVPQPVEAQPVMRPVQTQAAQPVPQVVSHEVVREVLPMVSQPALAVPAPQQTPPVAETTEVRPVVEETAVLPPTLAAQTITRRETPNASPASPTEPAMLSQPAVEAPPATAIVQDHPMVKEDTRTAPLSAPIEQAPARAVPVLASPAGGPDYGWLVKALWARVEQLKRYPRLAQKHGWEGKVVLQAIIKENGFLQDVVVVESSGHAMLDHDAMETLKRASPFTLRQPLRQPEVIVQVPISYRLEQP